MRLRNICTFFLICAGGLLPATNSFAQPDTTKYFGYPKSLQRAHLKFVSAYVFFRMRRMMDADSAAILAADAEHLPYHLYYDEEYARGPESNIKKLLSEGNSYVFKTGTEQSDLDRALDLLTQANDEAVASRDPYWQHAALASLGKCYAQRRDTEASNRYFNEALALARKQNDPAMLTSALINHGTYLPFTDPQKEFDFQESLKLAQQKLDTVREVEIRTLIYQIYFVRRDMDTVRTQLEYVTQLEKSIGYKHLHYNYDVLAFIGQFYSLQAIYTNCREALASMEATGDYAFSNYVYATLADFYVDFDDEEHALEWLHKSLNAEQINRGKRLWYPQFLALTNRLGRSRRMRSVGQSLELVREVTGKYPPVTPWEKMHVARNLGVCYSTLHQRDSSQKYADIVLSYLEPPADELIPTDKYLGYLFLARFHFTNGKFELAKHYFRNSLRFASNKDIYESAAIHRFQYKLDSVDGNYLKALREFQVGQILWDSIYTLEKAAQMTERQVTYEVAAKDKDIELLIQKDKVQQATLERSTIEKRVTLGGIGVMIIISGLIFREYWNKQKRNKEMSEKNETLARLVNDKEWLVKEIHHRVKNNLQIIISLLRTQAAHLSEGDALTAIQESQSRMQVISLLHQKLYKGATDSNIDMKIYVPELVNCIREGIDSDGRITYEVDVDNIELDISQAVPVGLIFNEAITNAIKYAYPDGQRGKIHVYLKSNEARLTLGVSDHGRGLPPGFDYHNVSSMGMKLIETLGEQLEGKVDLRSKNGTTLKIEFART